MASNINPFNVDGTFPVAGQDNSSQGFRDNFTNIRNNLGFAATEISELQSKTIVTTALTGQTLTNDMNGSVLYRPALKSYYELIFEQGLISGSATLDYTNGNYQHITASGNVALAFANWPVAGILGKITVRISNPNTYTVSFPITNPGVTIGTNNIAGYNAGTVSFDYPGDYVFEFSTLDGGQNIVIRDLTRNATSLNAAGMYYNKQIDNSLYVGFDSTSLSTAISQISGASNGNQRITTLGAVRAVSVGNLAQANVTTKRTDFAPLGGYNIKAARGNLISNTTFTSYNAVRSSDYLGFVDVIMFTGNGVSNAYCQSSSISFYATGSNVSYGLGSNVTIFTKNDGGGVYQAIGVENDRSTKFYGNVVSTIGQGVPFTNTSTGTPGQIAVDANYLYVCVATNTWKRMALNLTSW
jgi:hypothetical protein